MDPILNTQLLTVHVCFGPWPTLAASLPCRFRCALILDIHYQCLLDSIVVYVTPPTEVRSSRGVNMAPRRSCQWEWL